MNSQLVKLTRGKIEFLDGLREVLTQADSAIARSGNNCQGCGECCDFASAEHRLYVSTGELALLSSVEPVVEPTLLKCPYQADQQCFARSCRPLGCRVYFCKSSLADDFYEQFHRKIIDFHKRFEVDYCYEELTSSLMELRNFGE